MKEIYVQKVYDSFWKKVIKRGPTECWTWIGGFHGQYGWHYLSPIQKTVGAHVASFILYHGLTEQPALDVLHNCHNNACVNPMHLRLGTHEHNMVDRELSRR